MSFEFHIDRVSLRQLLAESLQRQLDASCLDATPEVFVDRLDVLADSTSFQAAPDRLFFIAPVDVFALTRAEVLSAPNAQPAASTSPRLQAQVHGSMTLQGTRLVIAVVDIRAPGLPDPLQSLWEAARGQVLASVSTAIVVDLGPTVAALGIPAPNSSALELLSDAVSARFDAEPPPAPRLGIGQSWCSYLDAAAIVELATTSVRREDSELAQVSWRPIGTQPHIDAQLIVVSPLPDPLAGHARITVGLGIDLSVVQTPQAQLRILVQWGVQEVQLHSKLPGAVEAFGEAVIEAFLLDYLSEEHFNAASLGGRALGPRAFELLRPLPSLAMGVASLTFTNAHAWPDGMSLGGPVRLVRSSNRPVLVRPTPFAALHGPPRFCSALSGGRKRPLLSEVSTSAGVWMEAAGRICGYEVLAPAPAIDAFVTISGNTLNVTLRGAAVQTIAQSLQLIVRTPRGTRLVDLGRPPQPVIDAGGHVVNAITDTIDDCLWVSRDWWRVMTTQIDIFGQDVVFGPGPDDGPVPGLPGGGGWGDLWWRNEVLVLQVAALRGLEPGELIRWRSADHEATVSADAQGSAWLPGLVPMRDLRQGRRGGSMLERVNRESLRGHVQMRSLRFVRRASLPAGAVVSFTANERLASIGLAEAQQTWAYAVDSSGTLSRRQITEGPDHPPLPPLVPALSGFADAPLALRATPEGTTLISASGKHPSPRVAGECTGPWGDMRIVGDWALVESPQGHALFRIDREGDKVDCVCCGAPR